MLVEPLVRGKVVADVPPAPVVGGERLAAAGAAQLLRAEAEGLRLDLPDRSVDVVLCLSRLSTYPGDVERHRWLAELRRVLRPDGFAVVRIAAAALVGKSAPGGGSGASAVCEAYADLLRHHFPTVDMVSETHFLGASFTVPGVEDMTINEELASLSSEPNHFVAFCTEGRERTWELPESLFVPLVRGAPGGGVVGTPTGVVGFNEELEILRKRLASVLVERDGLRESLITVQDEADRRAEMLATLRRELERHLRQISEDAAAMELAGLERERIERRAVAAERALQILTSQLQQRKDDLSDLEREIVRLRAARGEAPDAR